jgi:hypothetical protein
MPTNPKYDEFETAIGALVKGSTIPTVVEVKEITSIAKTDLRDFRAYWAKKMSKEAMDDWIFD